MIHDNPHPLEGQKVTVDLKHIHPKLGDRMIHEVVVVDYFDRIVEASWINVGWMPNAQIYGMRSAFGRNLPVDDEVILVQYSEDLSLLIHETEIME